MHHQYGIALEGESHAKPQCEFGEFNNDSRRPCERGSKKFKWEMVFLTLSVIRCMDQNLVDDIYVTLVLI